MTSTSEETRAARYVRDTVANAHEEEPGTLGRLCVQADSEDFAAKLLLDRIVVNDTGISNPSLINRAGTG